MRVVIYGQSCKIVFLIASEGIDVAGGVPLKIFFIVNASAGDCSQNVFKMIQQLTFELKPQSIRVDPSHSVRDSTQGDQHINQD